MKKMMLAVAATGLLVGCSDDAPPPPKAAEAAAALSPGEYEIVAKVDELRSTDKTTPATKSKVGGEPVTTRTCVGPENKIEPAAFVEAGETCTASDSYFRNGRISLQYKCSRPAGILTQLVDGDFKADSFTAQVRTATSYAGSGDYELVRSFTAKRVGDCTAKAG
ncbi:MAG: DUF3617 domain-containing protein [Sphingomicrobium sp.]